MRRVRLHVSLFDEPPSSHQRTIAFIEVDALLPDDRTLDEYLAGLTARCYVQDENDAQSTADLTPRGGLS